MIERSTLVTSITQACSKSSEFLVATEITRSSPGDGFGPEKASGLYTVSVSRAMAVAVLTADSKLGKSDAATKVIGTSETAFEEVGRGSMGSATS